MGEYRQIIKHLFLIILNYMVTTTHVSSSNCSCGNVYSEMGVAMRVVGGGRSEGKSHPELAGVLMNGAFVCGGSVISPQHVLTAAHCVPNLKRAKEFSVGLGVHDKIEQKSQYIKIFKIRQIIRHDGYQKLFMGIIINDIALLKMDGTIDFNEYIQAVCLPFHVDVSGYKAGLVEGWGSTSEGGFAARYPQQAVISLLTVEQCQKSTVHKMIRHVKDIDKMSMCAYRQNVDSCQGDSGGPLLVTTPEGKRVQIGIVSFGMGCGNDEGYPGIYTRVSYFLNWIKKYAYGFCAGP